MNTTDVILALLALAGMYVFTLILIFFVKEPALSAVIIIGLAMMTYDFWRLLQAKRRKL